MAKDRLMYYGKGNVFVYRTYGKPLTGITPIPESSFAGRQNVVFGFDITMSVRGESLLSSFTEGDNSPVVATDSMKNFVERQAARYGGATCEGFLEFVARRFLETYAHIDGVRLLASQIPFDPVPVPGGREGAFTDSGLVYRRSRNEYATAMLEMARRSGSSFHIVEQRSGIADLQLLKVTGNSFTGYIRDEYTTLPEATDRPLFIYLNIGWRYENVQDALSEDRYVPAEQVGDIARTVFHELFTPSIQNLIYHIGRRTLERFPQLAQVEFESQNRTWDTVVETIPGSEGRVYAEPRPPYGFQRFAVTREDLG